MERDVGKGRSEVGGNLAGSSLDKILFCGGFAGTLKISGSVFCIRVNWLSTLPVGVIVTNVVVVGTVVAQVMTGTHIGGILMAMVPVDVLIMVSWV